MRWMLLMLTAVLAFHSGVFAEDTPAAAPEPVFESEPMLPCGVFEKARRQRPGSARRMAV